MKLGPGGNRQIDRCNFNLGDSCKQTKDLNQTSNQSPPLRGVDNFCGRVDSATNSKKLGMEQGHTQVTVQPGREGWKEVWGVLNSE